MFVPPRPKRDSAHGKFRRRAMETVKLGLTMRTGFYVVYQSAGPARLRSLSLYTWSPYHVSLSFSFILVIRSVRLAHTLSHSQNFITRHG